MLENTVCSASLLVIILASAVGVFSTKFDDNLLQRFGLSMACLGAVLRLVDLMGWLNANDNARYLMTYGFAFFSVGTAWKFWRR